MLGQPRVGNWKQLDYRYRLSRRALQEACSQPRPIVRLAVSIEPSGPTMIPSSERMTTAFIHHPGLSGPFGALMDEYARAAEDFCRVVESFDLAGFDAERPSNNPNTISPRAICLHVIGAAHRYAHYIRKARGVDFVERYEADPARLHSPGCPRFVNRRNRVGGADRRAAAEGNRARNSGAVVRGALGSAIRPGDDPRARGLPLAAASPATGALVVIYGREMGIRGRRSPD